MHLSIGEVLCAMVRATGELRLSRMLGSLTAHWLVHQRMHLLDIDDARPGRRADHEQGNGRTGWHER